MFADSVRDSYDAMFTHSDPASPYYDGPIIGEDCCEHGTMYTEPECDLCLLEMAGVDTDGS